MLGGLIELLLTCWCAAFLFVLPSSEILDFVMGTGLIPADGEVWRTRRRVIVPALHRRYVESMVREGGGGGRGVGCITHAQHV